MNKKVIALSFSLLTENVSLAKDIFAGDVLARELNTSGLGWAGHVGIATGEVMNATASLIIEALDTYPHIQLNSISQFKKKSTYWGSRYGIGDYATHTRSILIEANHQRWWCPKYTIFPTFTVGDGNLMTGNPTRCGEWRCDTFVAYSFASGGYSQLISFLPSITPKRVFEAFPFTNSQLMPLFDSVYFRDTNISFLSFGVESINNMSLGELQSTSAVKIDQETPEHINKEWFFAKNKQLKSIYRGFFIDSLIRIKSEDTITKLIEMYQNETEDDVKNKIITATMLYYQSHIDINKNSNDKTLLIKFYKQLIDQKIDSETTHDVIRGYVDLNTSKNVLSNIKLINKQMAKVEIHLLLGLKIQLAHKSIELEKIYIPSLISMLQRENSSDLDEMFFGITEQSYEHLRDRDSLNQIKAYMNSVSRKYMAPQLLNTEDYYYDMASNNFELLRKKVKLK